LVELNYSFRFSIDIDPEFYVFDEKGPDSLGGDTNNAIIVYKQDFTFSYYDTVSSIIYFHINLNSEADNAIKADMDPFDGQ